MNYLYLDNFRGFQNALIPLRNVTFCVGENSSGKTSFLSAINLLSSHRFWFDQSFEGAETGFGHFSDYVSVASTDQSYFRMGVVESIASRPDGKSRMDERAIRAYLFTYVEKDGAPQLFSCTTNFGDGTVTLYFSDQEIRYRVKAEKKLTALDQIGVRFFRKWAAIQDDRSLVGTKKIGDEAVKQGYMPALYALSIALSEVTRQRSGKASPRFFPETPFAAEAAWIAPIRTKPRRTYDEVKREFSPEGMHVPYLIKRLLDEGEKSKRFEKFLRRFGVESGLFRDVRIHKFGSASSSPFELEIVLESLPLNISSVGYGVSQGLPVMVEAFARGPGSLFAIQQPEVHLHPRAQASFGEMVFELASNERKRFIVETHSDFMIDRFRISQRESKKRKVESQVLFFERVSGKNVVASIPISDDGELADQQPKKYREFFLKEGLRVIGV